ncbi:MAG: serine/threonine protein kinase [Alphaproteobacteria bacterium]|nr:serine/threonine protein kinase [Alphaproteobacteria bacterium]
MSNPEALTQVSDSRAPRGAPSGAPAQPAIDAETVARAAQPAAAAVTTGGTYPPGSVLLTSFRIEALVASGGMGSVYRATHLVTGATVAIKTIRSELASDPKMGDLFKREAQALRRIAHPAIVRYEGAFSTDNGQMVLVMEFVEGPSLMEVLRGGPLSPKAALALRNRLAAGLAAAHREGVVHRDLSPDNVILPGGRIEDAKIIDFGIARQERAEGATLVGSDFAGKLAWAAPEQFGLFGGKVDHRADIFSLGLIVAASVIGRPLEMGTSITGAVHARTTEIDLAAVPASLRKELHAMLQPDPAKRPATMDALLPVDARAAWIGARRWRWLAAASVVIALGATVVSLWEVDEYDPWVARLLGRSATPAGAGPHGAGTSATPQSAAAPGADVGTVRDAMALEGRYGGTACHAGKDVPCSSGILTVHHGRAIGSWPASDDRLINVVDGSIDAGGVVRLHWRRVDGSDNLMDQVFLTGTITQAQLQAKGKWSNSAAEVEIVWTRVD